MFILEVHDNPNCEAVEMRIFHDLEPPRPVTQVRVERTPGQPEWCALTGWTASGAPCPALARKVDDSGEGVVFLISGGDAGLRLQPTGQQEVWRLESSVQWGAPFLLIAEPQDLRLA